MIIASATAQKGKKKKTPSHVTKTLAAIKASGCFRCDGSKMICNTCGESSRACRCDEEQDLTECPDCSPTKETNANRKCQ